MVSAGGTVVNLHEAMNREGLVPLSNDTPVHQLGTYMHTLATITSTCATTILTTPTACAIYTITPTAVARLSIRSVLTCSVVPWECLTRRRAR